MNVDSEFDKFITDAFRKEPDFFLPADFADKMTGKIIRRYSFRENLKEYLILTVIFLGLAIVVGGFLLFINKDNLSQILVFTTKHLIEIISLIFIANFILFADKVLLRLLFTFKQ